MLYKIFGLIPMFFFGVALFLIGFAGLAVIIWLIADGL